LEIKVEKKTAKMTQFFQKKINFHPKTLFGKTKFFACGFKGKKKSENYLVKSENYFVPLRRRILKFK